MTQNNSGYQDLIINNGVISTVSNLVSSDNNALQGIQMNQFTICANPGSTPLLVPYISPMLLSPHTTKMNMDGSSQDNRSQNGQIQLTNNITIPTNMINSGNLPLGLSYINLASLTSQSGGTTIPFQFALNTGQNQQFTLPLASITQLTNDLQISNAYTLAPQIKFEPEINSNDQMNQMSDRTFQKPIVKHETDTSVVEIQSNKRNRKKVIVRKVNQKRQKLDDVESTPKPANPNPVVNGDTEILFDHKGRPFTYPCNQCSKKFTQNSRLTAHLRCHSGIRPYTCTQCGFSFTQKSYLIRHAAVHKEDRPFTCAKCLKTYKHYGSLANHRKLHCRETMNDLSLNNNNNNNNNNNVSRIHDTRESDDLDETIQQTIESVQMNHQNNYILTYTTTNNSDLHSAPIIYFNQNTLTNNNNNNNNISQSNTIHTELQLPGTGPVVFPSQELPSISAVSLLPPNRSAINELKALTTQLARNVDVDDIPSSMDFQHHIKQEPTYFNVALHSGHSAGDSAPNQ